ncbi:MAG: metalloregulator ArsR/SmtB family transcription factor [Elusimicrobiota bacterium]|jgi:ArsR family transcriptional regulator
MALAETLRLLDVIAEPNRLRILNALSARKMCVCELCGALKLKQSVMSQHLRVLRDCGLVQASKNGLWVDYRLSPSALAGPAGRILKTILTETQRDDTIRKDREASAKIDRRALCAGASAKKTRRPRA